jgi:hypothetical protein
VSRPPTTYAPTAPAYDPQPYSPPAPAPAPAGRFDDYRGAGLQPPPAAPPPQPYTPPAGLEQPRYGEPTTRYSPQVANDRFASVPPSTNTAATIPPRAGEPEAFSAGAPIASPQMKDQWWWPYWLVVIFSLFLSIGGNFYLGWTAAEFYSRYRLAVDRLRTAGRT